MLKISPLPSLGHVHCWKKWAGAYFQEDMVLSYNILWSCMLQYENYLFHSSIPQIPLDSHQRKHFYWSHSQPLYEQHMKEFPSCNIHSTNHHVWNHMSVLDHFDMPRVQLVVAKQTVPQPCSTLLRLRIISISMI